MHKVAFMVGRMIAFLVLGFFFGRGPAVAAAFQVQQTPAGVFLKDNQGGTLYFRGRDEDAPATSCDAKCLATWKPFLAPQGSKTQGDWALEKGTGDIQQWTFRGRKLFRYVKDLYPGAQFGSGLDDMWHVAFVPIPTPPGVEVASTSIGYVLVDASGHILFGRDENTTRHTMPCSEDCAAAWVPLAAPAAAVQSRPWSTIKYGDGMSQWAFNNQPLFVSRMHRDEIEKSALGEALAHGWKAQVLLPKAMPRWVNIQHSDMGAILADKSGATLYTFEGQLEGMRKLACNDACLRENWKPVDAMGTEKPMGDWSIIVADNGRYQWAYRGSPLYTFLKDEKPGHIRGDRFGTFGRHDYFEGAGWWRPILASCLCVPP